MYIAGNSEGPLFVRGCKTIRGGVFLGSLPKGTYGKDSDTVRVNGFSGVCKKGPLGRTATL